VNTFQTIGEAKGAKRLLAGGLWIPLAVALVAVSAAMSVQAADGPPPVNTPLGMTQGQLVLKLASRVSPPYTGSDVAGAMAYLNTFTPPVVPIGGWQPNQPATVGDLTVCLCKLLHLGVGVNATSGQPTAQDYQSSLVSFANTVGLQAVQAISNSLIPWVAPTLNPFGPTPNNTPIRTGTNP
jgi:hypothetical protein